MAKMVFWIFIIVPFVANFINTYFIYVKMPREEKLPTLIKISITESLALLIPWALFILVRSIFWAG